MGEKRGSTGKLECPFNQDGSLEIKTKKDVWSRVTSREFRSFNGPRRIYQPTDIVRGHGNLDIKMEYVDYFGPVYAYGTNDQVIYEGTRELVESDVLVRFREISQLRQ